MPLEIENFADLQKLREIVLSKEDPQYRPGTIPIAEIAEANGVSVRTMVAAFRAGGLRKIDDLSMLTITDAGSAGPALHTYRELKNPKLAKRRRSGQVPVTDFSFQLGLALDDLLEVCVQVGFSARIAKSDLWLDRYEQDLVRAWIDDSRFPPHEPSKSSPPYVKASSVEGPPDAIHAQAVKNLLEGPQTPLLLVPPPHAVRVTLLPVDTTETRAVQPPANNGQTLNPPKQPVATEISGATIERDFGDFSSQRLKLLLGDREVLPAPKLPVFRTSIGRGKVEVRQLQRTLDSFRPSSYGDFFHQMLAALRFDTKIQRSMLANDAGQKHWTDATHAKFIKEICTYSYGIFAYADVGFHLATKARKATPQNQKAQTASLYKFRPMYKGLLTDESRSQFILWRVGNEIPDLLVIKWDALSGWLDGMESGHYVGLRARHIRVVNNLDGQDQDVVKLMVAMADNLRSGARQTAPRPVETVPKGRKQLVGQRTTAPRSLGYKPQSEWLVPITVSGRNVSTGLDDDFFTAHGGMRPHRVRSFLRRESGAPSNAPKTVLVRSHIRGGRLFEDAKLLPAVTIRR